MLSMSLLASDGNSRNEETLFGGGEIRHGGYGGPEMKVSQINGNTALFLGGRGGWIINGTFSIGLGGYGLVTNHTISNYFLKDTACYLRVGYGGLFLNYTNESDKLIHFTINALIGAGGAAYTRSWDYSWDWHNDDDCDGKWSYEHSAFFIFEPGVGIELNLTGWMRVEAGASYRFVSNLDLSRTTNKDLSGLSGNLIFKFGSF
jgi:hypothetical protein